MLVTGARRRWSFHSAIAHSVWLFPVLFPHPLLLWVLQSDTLQLPPLTAGFRVLQSDTLQLPPSLLALGTFGLCCVQVVFWGQGLLSELIGLTSDFVVLGAHSPMARTAPHRSAGSNLSPPSLVKSAFWLLSQGVEKSRGKKQGFLLLFFFFFTPLSAPSPPHPHMC